MDNKGSTDAPLAPDIQGVGQDFQVLKQYIGSCQTLCM